MSSLTGDGAPKDLRNKADEEDESTRVDRAVDDLIASHHADESDGMGGSPQTAVLLDEATIEVVRAIRAERRAAYLDSTPDEHHPDL